VKPQGYVIISLLRELVPVKAYSSSCNLDPTSEQGMADLLKSQMTGILDKIIAQVGPLETADEQALKDFLRPTYDAAWEEIEQGVDMNYQAGDTLVDTFWHQGDPYNQFCPGPPGGDDCTDPRCMVGCVATAAAQIMRYWCWPPYAIPPGLNDPYDWANMPLAAYPSSPQVVIDAVAELSYEIGLDVGMNYCSGEGCQSGAQTYDMEIIYERDYRYAPMVEVPYRSNYEAVEWFEEIKLPLNCNRPIQYRIPGHSIVCDGWQEIGGGPLRQYHMNYGWANSATAWYTLDNLQGGNPDEEYMVWNIYPLTALGASLSGTYPLNASFPYRYFDLDASGTVAAFDAGQYLQFLPDIKVTCATGSGNNVRFLSSSAQNTRLYTRGNAAIGAKLTGGGIRISPNGCLKLY
jgi:hypothetical protein